MLWQQAIGVGPLTPLYATADGGAIVTDYGDLYTLDQNGNLTSQLPDTGAVYSWTGQWYDPPAGSGYVASVTLPGVLFAPSYAAIQAGNPSLTPAAIPSLGAFCRKADADKAKGYIGNSVRWNEENRPAQCSIFVHGVL